MCRRASIRRGRLRWCWPSTAAAGPWLHPALDTVNAPAALRFEIIRKVAADMMDCVRAFDDAAAGIHVVETAGTLTPAAPGTSGSDADWENEIHPNTAGYDKRAMKIGARLAALGVR